MAKKKPEQQAPPEDSQLEAKVDAMMSTEQPDPVPAAPFETVPESEIEPVQTAGSDLPPLDIFAGATGAPEVPEALLKDTDLKKPKAAAKKASTEIVTEEPQKVAEPQPVESPELDDAATDAAVDDIVAHEADDLLETEDAEESKVVPKSQAKRRHHPLFWALITFLAVVAIAVAILLITGGNLEALPGGSHLQSWWHTLQNKI